MDLKLKDSLFLVTGATSGFGRAIAVALADEGAHLILNARTESNLKKLQEKLKTSVEIVVGDVSTDAVISQIFKMIGERKLSGALINAGGPPAKSFRDTDMSDWDDSYNMLLRWKVKFTHELISKMVPQQYGRIIYIESATVKQPMENLVLSNSLRLAVVGFVKTLSLEVADKGITLNILAPGFHATPAVERIFKKKSVLMGISMQDAKEEFEKDIKVGHLGDPKDLASLAVWLLSASSKYITGQTISVEGGLIKGVMG